MQISQEPLICYKDTWCSVEPERQTIFVGTAAGGSIGMQLGARGAMPGIPGSMQMNQGPPGPMTQLLQQEGPPPPLHTTSALMPGVSEVCHLRYMSPFTSYMPSNHAVAAYPALYKLSLFYTHVWEDCLTMCILDMSAEVGQPFQSVLHPEMLEGLPS